VAKKSLLLLIIGMLAAGGAFAQSNTITVDVGPTVAGLIAQSLSSTLTSMAENVGSFNVDGFSIAAQYERQLIKQLSVAARGVYGKYTVGVNFEQNGASAKANLDIVSWAAEGHARFYPLGETFFLDGMVGFSQLSSDLSGRFFLDESSSINRDGKAEGSSNYLKYGGKLGWRISFGRNGGFTFEPAIGYYAQTALNGALGKKLSDSLSTNIGYPVEGIDEELSILENFIFVGGPRVTLAFGYRF
jgi:hypothetical protein